MAEGDHGVHDRMGSSKSAGILNKKFILYSSLFIKQFYDFDYDVCCLTELYRLVVLFLLLLII